MKLKYPLLICFALLLQISVMGQFYNGLQMPFGKNRVQYNQFEWQYYRFDRFDTYYYAGVKDLAQYASTYANAQIPKWEKYFNNPMKSRLIFIVYNKQSEFKQSNIGLVTGLSDSNLGGTKVFSDNKAYLFFDGNHQHFQQQIDARLVELQINQSLFGGNFSERMATKALLDLPSWYISGLTAYLSEGWTPEIEAIVRDRIQHKKFKRLNTLNPDESRLAGLAIWNYVARNFGENVIPSLIYLTKAHRSYEASFNFITGEDFKDVYKEWMEFYLSEASLDAKDRDSITSAKIVKRPKRYRTYQRMHISPNGRYTTYASNNYGKIKVWLYDSKTKKSKRIYKRFHKLPQIPDYSQPVFAWHPTNKLFCFAMEDRGKIWMNYYDLATQEITKSYLPGIDKVNSISYSHNGMNIVLSATKHGRTDIFLYSVLSRTLQQITNDMADDFDPKFVDNSRKIVFSSNRIENNITPEKRPYLWAKNPLGVTSNQTDLFLYNIATKSLELQRLTNTPHANETQPYELSPNRYLYLSDKNGMNNQYIARYDSAISRIDTAVHYRFFSENKPLSNYAHTTFGHSVSTDSLTTLLQYRDKRFQLLTQSLSPSLATNSPLQPTQAEAFRQRVRNLQQQRKLQAALAHKREQARIDSIRRNVQAPDPDTLTVNVNAYRFENEKLNPYQRSSIVDSLLNIPLSDSILRPKGRVYYTAFYNDVFAAKADLGFANQFYQSYTGQFFNPQMNLSSKYGTKDLFENMKFFGGYNIDANLSNYSYLLGVEFLKERWDKMYLFQEQSYRSLSPDGSGDFPADKKAYLLTHASTYPLSQVAGFRASITGRMDRLTPLSESNRSLEMDNFYQFWTTLKTEYIFDNTFQIEKNIQEGTKGKVWGEFHKEIMGRKTHMFVVGTDWRKYLRIHRNLIWANRFAASSSFGGAKLMYYLGGVDNWWNFTDVPTFDESTPQNKDLNYQFQAIATNLRGFSQNARNGTTFFAVNSELRWPIFSYFSPHRLRMEFFRDFQLIGFLDAGSAWNGLTPFDVSNNYNYEVIENNPITVTIHRNRSPVIWGYGFGMRTSLLGYFVRADWAWGVDDSIILPRVFYLSLSLDF